jgi:hypothetical protein
MLMNVDYIKNNDIVEMTLISNSMVNGSISRTSSS